MCKKTIVCLANSYREGGRCIAGLEILRDWRIGEWIRPIANQNRKSINVTEMTCSDGTRVNVLDVVEIPFSQHMPSGHHTEDHIIAPGIKWVKKGKMSSQEARQLAAPLQPPLWVDGNSSTHGLNDRVSRACLIGISSSLKFIHLDRLILHSLMEDQKDAPPKRAIRAIFSHGSAEYKLKLTDPKYWNLEIGEHHLRDVLICVSLGEIYEKTGHAYKIVASVIKC